MTDAFWGLVKFAHPFLFFEMLSFLHPFRDFDSSFCRYIPMKKWHLWLAASIGLVVILGMFSFFPSLSRSPQTTMASGANIVVNDILVHNVNI